MSCEYKIHEQQTIIQAHHFLWGYNSAKPTPPHRSKHWVLLELWVEVLQLFFELDCS
jgi:hypothetical protein